MLPSQSTLQGQSGLIVSLLIQEKEAVEVSGSQTVLFLVQGVHAVIEPGLSFFSIPPLLIFPLSSSEER